MMKFDENISSHFLTHFVISLSDETSLRLPLLGLQKKKADHQMRLLLSFGKPVKRGLINSLAITHPHHTPPLPTNSRMA